MRDIPSREPDAQADPPTLLGQKEESVRALADLVPDMLFTCRPDGSCDYISDRFHQYAGLSDAVIKGGAWSTVAYPDDVEPVWQCWRQCLKSEVDFESHLRLRGADGGYRWFLVRARPLRDPEGNILKWFGSCIDIHDLKQSEGALRESESRLAFALETAELGIWDMLEPDHTVWRSPRHDRIFGYPEMVPDWSYKKFLEHLLPEEREEIRRRFSQSLKHHTGWNFDCRIRRADGALRWIHLQGASRFDEQGQPVRVLGLVRDITDQKEAELNLRDLNQTLEQRVAQRTAELQARAEQLRDLAAALTEAEERERQRVARVLHDQLQQTLVAAKLRSAGLSVRLTEPALVDRVLEITQLLDEGIEVSRSLTAELSPPVLYDAGLAPALLWLARRMRERHRLEVAAAIDHAAEPDSEELRIFLFQAARELLFNVVKHGGVNDACLTLRIVGGDQVRLEVSDVGRGFEVPAEADRQARRSGFGLFSVRERLALLGGRMDLVSRPGQGTRVSLWAPLRRAPIPHPPHQPPAGPALAEGEGPANVAPSATPGRAPGEAVRILLVDDHEMLRVGLARLLTTYPGIEVIAQAADGQEAVELARTLRPDVVLMDISMPRLGGIEATRRITAAQPAVRVVGLSMHEPEEVAQAMRQAGAAAYLTKGEPIEDLLRAIHGTLPASNS